MHLPRQEAAKRAIGRFLNPENGRFVPPEVVLSNTGNEASFDAVRPLVDAWSFRDNNVAKGEEPKLISESGDADKRTTGDNGQHGLPSASKDVDRDTGLAAKDGRGESEEGIQKAFQILGRFEKGRRVIFFTGRR